MKTKAYDFSSENIEKMLNELSSIELNLKENRKEISKKLVRCINFLIKNKIENNSQLLILLECLNAYQKLCFFEKNSTLNDKNFKSFSTLSLFNAYIRKIYPHIIKNNDFYNVKETFFNYSSMWLDYFYYLQSKNTDSFLNSLKATLNKFTESDFDCLKKDNILTIDNYNTFYKTHFILFLKVNESSLKEKEPFEIKEIFEAMFFLKKARLNIIPNPIELIPAEDFNQYKCKYNLIREEKAKKDFEKNILLQKEFSTPKKEILITTTRKRSLDTPKKEMLFKSPNQQKRLKESHFPVLKIE